MTKYAYLCNVEYMTQCNIRDFIERTKNEYLYVGGQDIAEFRKPELFKDIENPYIDNKAQTSVMFFGKICRKYHSHSFPMIIF